MDSVDQYVPTDEESDDGELLREQYEIRSAEESFRTLLSRITTAAIFLVFSLIVYCLLPFYPLPMAIFLALIPAIVAYRWPAIALFLLLLFASPAYSYQLGITIWALGIMIAVAAVLPFGLSRLPGASIGSAAGAAAAVLMLTPYFYLSLPLLAGTTLFRFKGSTAGGAWGLFIFLVFYLPFLAVADTSAAADGTIPLFTQVDYARQSALSNLDMNSLKGAFEGQLNNNFGGFSAFPDYFVNSWGGVALVLSLFAAIVITPTIINATRHLREDSSILSGLIPLGLILTVELVFLLPLLLLASPLGYHTGFIDWVDIARLTGIVFAVGFTAFIVETWLRRRNLKVEFRSELAILSLELYDLLDSIKMRLHQIGTSCRNCDLSSEKATVSQYEEKVALTLESVGALSLAQLEQSYHEFGNMQMLLPTYQQQLESKLYTHLEESKRSYRAIVEQAKALGISSIEDMTQTLPSSPDHNDFNSSLWEQHKINDAFHDLANKLVATGDTVAQTINDEIDPEFALTTIDISHGFLDQGRFDDAARTISEDLQIIDGRIESSIIELANRVISLTNDFKNVVATRLIPVLESIGDTELMEKYNSAVAELEAIAKAVHNSRTLADIISIVEQSRKLDELSTTTVRELEQKIKHLEEDNDHRCPAKYSWGKNSHAASEIKQFLSSIKHTSSEPSISSRFNLIEKAVQAVEQQAKTIKQYSQINEFFINYPNIEYIVQERLSAEPTVGSTELPVKPRYAQEYLKMYAAMNHKLVTYDAKTGVLKHISNNGSSEEEIVP